MRIKFLAITFLFLAFVSVSEAKDKKPKPVKPVYLNTQPQRIKPVFDRAQFEKGGRVRSSRDRAAFEKPMIAKSQIEKPKFDKDQQDQPAWARSVLETKWQTDSQPYQVKSPVEQRGQSKVKRGWFRDLRAP